MTGTRRRNRRRRGEGGKKWGNKDHSWPFNAKEKGSISFSFQFQSCILQLSTVFTLHYCEVYILLYSIYMRLCKTAPPCEPKNHATFTPHIESFLRGNNSPILSLHTQDCQFLQNIKSHNVCLCPELSLNLCFFTLTLSHAYTYNK